MKTSSRRQPVSDPGVRNAILAAGLSDTGRVRDHNEDAYSIVEDLGLYILSDGMGGHEGGEVASKMVTEALPINMAPILPASSNFHEHQLLEALQQSICNLNRVIHRKASEVTELMGMGATVVACLVRRNIAAIAHLGDSRAYLMRNGAFEQLTEDHTIVDLLLKLGQISKKQAEKHPARHALTRYVGMEGDMEPEIGLLELKSGDRLLLCSDGLTNEVSNRKIGEILRTESDLNTVCEKLVQTANDAGGRDNITVLIIQVDGYEGKTQGKKNKVLVRRKIGRSLRKAEPQAESLQF